MQSLRQSLLPRLGYRAAFSTSTPRSLARMQIIGRLADTPELVPTSTGRQLVRYAIGSQYGKPDENGRRQISWYKVSYFPESEGARDLVTGLAKGTQIYVEADARLGSFENDQGGKQMSLNLVARNFEVLSRPKPREGEEGAAPAA